MLPITTRTIPQFTLRLHLRELFATTKPKVVALMLLTALVGALLAHPGWYQVPRILFALLGIALMAGSAASLNHLIDRKLDRRMGRTARRPLPMQQVSPAQVLMFALLLGATGFALLWGLVNPLTAWLTFAALVGYALVYTAWLKHQTPQNIVIGGIAGAVPPLLGWTAVTAGVHAHPLLLVMIIFTWTPPHFWALAIARSDEYRRAGVPMLPVTHGKAFTARLSYLYTLLLMLVCLLPVWVGMSGVIYLIGTLLLNARFVQLAWRVLQRQSDARAMTMFLFSIKYLMLLFVLILTDAYYSIALW